MIIDIHNHRLFGVDDGAETLEDSIHMLQDAKRQEIEKIILTPHYRRGMFAYPTGVIEENFIKLKEKAGELGMELFLGCEYHVNSDIVKNLQSGRCKTLAESDYVLTEYSYQTEYSYIAEQTQHLLSCGYFPVIAHVERYQCLQKKPVLCKELADMGALIQINADSVLGLDGFSAKQFCRKLLKKGWADIIASDAHNRSDRACNLKECRVYTEKKYGSDYAALLFYDNPMRILSNR